MCAEYKSIFLIIQTNLILKRFCLKAIKQVVQKIKQNVPIIIKSKIIKKYL